MNLKIQTALLSCSDKNQLEGLVKTLSQHGIRMVASGGTETLIRKLGYDVTPVHELTGAPEMLDGRVKTLHPAIHGGILYRRDHSGDCKTMKEHDLRGIDLVVCNLYPFESKPSIEEIDVGGPTMIRAAAKNHAYVTVLCHPDQYSAFAEEIQKGQGTTSLEFRRSCAARVFALTAHYDAAISQWFQGQTSDKHETFQLSGIRALPLRYGENPQQSAALYTPRGTVPFKQLQGKELSYNNLTDMDAAYALLTEARGAFRNEGSCVCVIIKHQNPCGFGIGRSPEEAWDHALQGDREAAFGGIVACSHAPTLALAQVWKDFFLEVMIAPQWPSEVVQVLSSKKNLRLIEWDEPLKKTPQVRSWRDGFLVQDQDSFEPMDSWTVETEKQPTDAQRKSARIAWFVCRFVKSNAIVAACPTHIVGVGSGQMSRVDSMRIVSRKISERSEKVETIAIASDAFFPFADSIEMISKSGVGCVIQPMGSVRDSEVVAACNNHKISMIATHCRHFYH